ncbi:ABC transporter substrate-binding protein [Microbacterium sp. NPDC003461]|jgi:peptide/nickel transport system substrate-binding protein
MSRKLLVLPLLAVSGLVLAGCASATGTSATEAGMESAADTDATVHLQVGLEPTSLDVSAQSGASLEQLLIPNVYEGLVDADGEGGFEPALATDWTVSDDGLTYTFTIRDDVAFHSGSPLTMDDVVWSLEAAAADDSLNPDAGLFAGIDEITPVDDSTLEITLASRDSDFLESLTSNAGVILEEGADVDLANETNGTGPYTVTQWNQGSTITLERNDDYWGEAPLNREVVFHYMTDATTAANALLAGEIDVLTTTTADTLSMFEGDDAFTLTEGDSRSWMTLGFNNAVEPLNDERVRHAIRRAIDKDGLIEVLGGQATRVGSMASPADPWYEDLTDIDAYDPESARELLAEAGQEDLELTFRVSNTYDTRISEYVAAQLAEVGIDVTIEQMEFSSWLEQVFTGGDYEMTMVLHVAPALAKNYSNPDYYWNYDDATAQQLVADAREALELEERNEKLRELARHISEQAVSDWLFSPTATIVASADVTGFPVDGIANRLPVSGIQVAAR